MKTKRVKRTKGKVLATGYKIFTSNWGNKQNDYIYGTDEDIVRTIHKVDGDIEQCRWGLHFCPNPLNCYSYYEPCQWNKFAKVEAYDQLIDNGDKYVTNMLKIVEIYTFDKFIEEIKKYTKENYGSGISGGYGIRNGYGINNSWGLTNCEGCSRCILCYDYTGKLAIFNKEVTEERYNKVLNELYYRTDWYPKFNNAYDLKGDKEWEETDVTRIESISLKDAWSTILQELDKYIRNLEEFDEEIYNKIRGIE